MMNKLVRAEWRKTTGNTILVGCTIWLYPLLGLVLVGLFVILLIFDANFAELYRENPPTWDEFGIFGWTTVFEEIGIFRLPMLGFMAYVFTNEYQLKTWKSVLPGNRRIELLGAKFIAVALFVVLALVVMSAVVTVGLGMINLVMGLPYEPSFNIQHIADFAVKFVLIGALAFVAMIMMGGLAALLGVWTRSVSFSVAAILILSLIESVGIRIPIGLLVNEFEFDRAIYMFLIMPTYNIANLRSYIDTGDPYNYALMSNGPQFSALVSATILLAWTALFTISSMLIFSRQDISE